MTSQLRSVETKRSNKVTLIFELFYFDLSIVCNRDLTLFLDFFFNMFLIHYLTLVLKLSSGPN